MASDKIIWKQLIYKTGIWVTVEIWLNLIGLDDIADYGEFIFAQDLALKKKNRRTVQVIEYPPQFCQQINDYCPLPGTVTKPQDLEHHSCKSKAETFKNKCQQLTEPCVKVVCLATNSEVNEQSTQAFIRY